MKKTVLHMTILSLVLLLTAGSCGFFFNNDGFITPGYIIVFPGDTQARTAWAVPPSKFPPFSKVTIRVTGNGTAADYSFSGNGPYSVPVPGGTYTVTLIADVYHLVHPGEDAFPFAKSFGGSAWGPFPNNIATIPLSLRETKIIYPGDADTVNNTYSIVSATDLSAESATKVVPDLSFSPDFPIPAFDIDPYGNLFTWEWDSSEYPNAYTISSFPKSANVPLFPAISESEPRSIAYDRKQGRLYYATLESGANEITINYIDSSAPNGQAITIDVIPDDIKVILGDFVTGLIAVHSSNGTVSIYVDALTGISLNKPVLLKYKLAGNTADFIGYAQLGDSPAIIRDMRVIGDYVYVITGDTSTSAGKIWAFPTKAPINQHAIFSNPTSTADNGQYFQQIVGWDDKYIYALEWNDVNSSSPISCITRLSKNLQVLEQGPNNTALYWHNP
jgi:hypothetical protein